MRADNRAKADHCACCKVCTNCPGFQKVLAVPDAGYVLYRHTTMVDDINKKTGALEQTRHIVDDVFILEKMQGEDLDTIDVTPEIDRYKIKCSRCINILKYAQKLIGNQNIGNSDVMGICQHCKNFGSTCVKCEEAVEMFQSSKRAQKGNRSQRLKTWLSNIQKIIKLSIFSDKKGKQMTRGYSEVDLNNLLRKTKPGREPVIEDLFLHGIRELYASKRGPRSEVPYFSKTKDKYIVFKEPKTDEDKHQEYIEMRKDFFEDDSFIPSIVTLTEDDLEKDFIRKFGKSYKDNLKYTSPAESKGFEQDFIPVPGIRHKFERKYESKYYDASRQSEEMSKDSTRYIGTTGELSDAKGYEYETTKNDLGKSYTIDGPYVREARTVKKYFEEKEPRNYIPTDERNYEANGKKYGEEYAKAANQLLDKPLGTDSEKKPERKLLSEAKETPSRIRKYRSEESILTDKTKINDDMQKVENFDYYFPESIQGRKKTKVEIKVSSSELIKDTLDKLKSKIELEERKRAEAERIKEERRKRLEQEKKEREEKIKAQQMAKTVENMPNEQDVKSMRQVSKEKKIEISKSKKEELKEPQKKEKVPASTKSEKPKKKIEGPKDEKPKPEKIKEETPNTEKFKEEKPKPERVKAQNLKSDKVKEEKPKTERVNEEKSKSDKVKEEKPKPERVKEEKSKSDKVKEEKPKPERVKEEKSKSDKVKEEKPKPERVKEEKSKSNKFEEEKPKPDINKEDKLKSEKDEKVKEEKDTEGKTRHEKAKYEKPKEDNTKRDKKEQRLGMELNQIDKEKQMQELKLQREEANKAKMEQKAQAQQEVEKKKLLMQAAMPKQKLEVALIKMKKPSIFDLIKEHNIKIPSPPKMIKIPTMLEFQRHMCKHGKKESGCAMCLDSDYDLDVQNILWKREDDELKQNTIKEVVLGENIFKTKTKFREEEAKDPHPPSLFQRIYKDSYGPAETVGPETRGELKSETAKVPQKADPEYGKGVVRYSLSDRTFIDKGWTKLPTEKIVRKMNVYRMRPAHPEFDWFEHNKNKGPLQYDTGERLAEIDENGRGRWFYRSGLLALDYYNAEEMNAQHRYVVYSSGEPDERGRTHPRTVLASFDYLGNGIVFDHTGKIRLKFNQTEGIILDRSLGPVSHWKWHTLNDPPVLQQVMIDTQMPHKDPHILKLGGPGENKPRVDDEAMLAIEFDNFIKEKSAKLSQTFKPFQIKMKALKINEYFSLRVLDQANVNLIYRDGKTNIKLNVGMILDHKEIVDTETAEVGEVSSNLEHFPAKTDSLAELQRNIANARTVDRIRFEKDRRVNRPQQALSVDCLKKAVSKPMKMPLMTVDSSSGVSRFCKCRKPSASNVYYGTGFV